MKYVEGNILDFKKGLIVQQVNCKSVMGVGLAKQIRDKYPKVFSDYLEHLNKCNRFGCNPLGTINSTSIPMGPTIYNFFAQDSYGRKGRHTDYEAFEKCLKALEQRFVNSKVEKSDIKVYFPYGIGCGLAGGDWSVVSRLISSYFPDAIIVQLKM